jgi:hypothetical protein
MTRRFPPRCDESPTRPLHHRVPTGGTLARSGDRYRLPAAPGVALSSDNQEHEQGSGEIIQLLERIRTSPATGGSTYGNTVRFVYPYRRAASAPVGAAITENELPYASTKATEATHWGAIQPGFHLGGEMRLHELYGDDLDVKFGRSFIRGGWPMVAERVSISSC